MSGEAFLLLVRLGFSLALVFGLMWVAVRVMKGRNMTLRKPDAENLEVIERRPLGRGSSLAIVRVHDRVLTVGITEQHITLLGERPAEGLVAANGPHGVTTVDLTDELWTSPASHDGEGPPRFAIPDRAGPESSPGSSSEPRPSPVDVALTSPPRSESGPAGPRTVLDSLRDMTVRHLPSER
ncbi:MAG: flagellar biosynthetic protein FliO [Microthrixaceae bacterium]